MEYQSSSIPLENNNATTESQGNDLTFRSDHNENFDTTACCQDLKTCTKRKRTKQIPLKSYAAMWEIISNSTKSKNSKNNSSSENSDHVFKVNDHYFQQEKDARNEQISNLFCAAIFRDEITISPDTSITRQYSKNKIKPVEFVPSTEVACRNGFYDVIKPKMSSFAPCESLQQNTDQISRRQNSLSRMNAASYAIRQSISQPCQTSLYGSNVFNPSALNQPNPFGTTFTIAESRFTNSAAAGTRSLLLSAINDEIDRRGGKPHNTASFLSNEGLQEVVRQNSLAGLEPPSSERKAPQRGWHHEKESSFTDTDSDDSLSCTEESMVRRVKVDRKGRNRKSYAKKESKRMRRRRRHKEKRNRRMREKFKNDEEDCLSSSSSSSLLSSSSSSTESDRIRRSKRKRHRNRKYKSPQQSDEVGEISASTERNKRLDSVDDNVRSGIRRSKNY